MSIILLSYDMISEKWLWHFWNTFVKCDTFVTNLWKMVTLLWRICNLCNFIIFLLSFNYLVTLLWHFCDTFVKISGPQLNLSTHFSFWSAWNLCRASNLKLADPVFEIRVQQARETFSAVERGDECSSKLCAKLRWLMVGKSPSG